MVSDPLRSSGERMLTKYTGGVDLRHETGSLGPHLISRDADVRMIRISILAVAEQELTRDYR